jgi:hypothetical protein
VKNEAKNWLELAESDYDASLYLFEGARYRDIAQTSYNTRTKTEPIMEQGKGLYLWIREQLNKP